MLTNSEENLHFPGPKRCHKFRILNAYLHAARPSFQIKFAIEMRREEARTMALNCSRVWHISFGGVTTMATSGSGNAKCEKCAEQTKDGQGCVSSGEVKRVA